MILDHLDNWTLYTQPGTRLAMAFHYLMHHFDPSHPDGRAEIEGDLCFALIQGYETRPVEDCRLESHKRYLDIQYVFEGEEGMGWCPVQELEAEQPYDAEKDVAFYHPHEGMSRARVRPGHFALFYPSDAHAPGIWIPGCNHVRKVVVKVEV